MNTYKVTGTRKGDKTAKVVTFHETRSKADWWIVEHYAEENGAHAYQVLIGTDTDEGTYWGDAYYFLDGRVCTESEWLKAVRG